MTKSCPKCGKQVPDDAKFCMDCGFAFSDSGIGSNIFSNGKIFLVIIAVVVILGLIVIGMTGNGIMLIQPLLLRIQVRLI